MEGVPFMDQLNPATDLSAPVDRAWIAEVIARVVGSMAPAPVERPAPDQTLVHDLGYHSLRLLELSFALEDLFEMEPATAEDAPPVGSVSELAAYMVGRMERRLGSTPTPQQVDAFLEGI
jgi:acyl carrier protein